MPNSVNAFEGRRRFRKRGIALGLGLAIAAVTVPQALAEDLKSLMSEQEYRAAGLDKLSDAERRALYQWIQQRRGGPTVSTAPAPAAAAPAAPASVAPTAAARPAPATAQPAPRPSQAAAEAAEQVAMEQNFGLEEPIVKPKELEELHARVVGKFRGWDGGTRFTLDNGQVWKQRGAGRYHYRGDDTRVVISKNAFGFYELRLVDADRSVGVRRIK